MTEQEIREQIAKEIEAIDIDSIKLNAVGMRMMVLEIVRGKTNNG